MAGALSVTTVPWSPVAALAARAPRTPSQSTAVPAINAAWQYGIFRDHASHGASLAASLTPICATTKR
jgi:hypothetical protein